MSKNFLNFFNPKNNSDRIYSREDIKQMSPEEYSKTREALYHQMSEVGVPSEAQLAASSDVIYVRAYTRDDGTKVHAHYRARRGSTYVEQITNNYTAPEAQIYTEKPLLGYVSADAGKPDMYINKYNLVRHPINTFHSAVNAGLNRNYPLTKEHMDMFIHGINKYFFNNGIKLYQPGELDGRLNVLPEKRRPPKGCYGVEFTENSEISKIVSLSPELKTKVIENIKNNKSVTSVEFKQNRDLIGSYHRVDIFGCKDEGNYYTGYLYDIYDFNSNYYGEYKGNTLLALANQYAVGMQWFGLGRKYYMIIPFKIKK